MGYIKVVRVQNSWPVRETGGSAFDQPGEKKSSGDPNSDLPIAVKRFSRRWNHDVQGDAC